MIVLNRLHRGDYPQMVAVTAVQTDERLVFTDEAGADAFIEAYRRADGAAHFDKVPVPEISLYAYWHNCRDLDWHYENSDDQGVWRKGAVAASALRTQSVLSDEHRRIYMGWRRHMSSGPAYGTEKRPAPEMPPQDAEQVQP